MITRRKVLKSSFATATLGIVPGLAWGQSLNAPPPLALHLARFLCSAQFADLPAVAVEHAKMIVASTLASAAAGWKIGSADIVRTLSKEQGGRPDATAWYDGAKLPITSAARSNAMASDASASDDSDLRNVAHTGTTVAATGLAIGEHTSASGQDLLAAIVTGYEAAGRVGEALMGHMSGFHASMIVAFGGTVTAARLLGLSDEQMAHAISLTATTVGGIGIGTNSWAREYHAGNAALTAVNAALAAGRGFTANKNLLEARRGFFATFGGNDVDTAGLVRDLGQEWDIVTHLAIKLLPGAHAFHPAVEAAINAAREADLPIDRVAHIYVSGPQHRTVARGRPPGNLIEAIHSLPYFLASAVADRDFTWVHATPEKISSPAMLRLIGLVEIDPSPPLIDYEWRWGATVTIVTTSGRRFTSTIDAPRASGPRGIEWRDVDTKYGALMPGSALPAKRIAEVLETVHRLERVRNIRELTRLLAPG